MKKMLSIILAVLLIACTLFSSAMGENETTFQVGEQLNGFTVTDVRTFDLIGADVVTLEHDKTGALVMLLMNEDTNRTFEITFRTVAENDHGTPHVFEHATLDGSEKYPSKELFFNLSYQTYNTYMNASTYPYMTTYPVASLSEEQLLKYADYYLDSCFNPMIYEDESLFREEAWRYVLASEEDELTVTGTVYSEMQGAFTIERAADRNFTADMFPGSYAANVSGGVPEEIINLTWEEVCDYHSRYYHPSNSMTCVYGKLDNPGAFLALLDNVFSAYEKVDYSGAFTDSDYTAIEESVTAYHQYGVENGSNTEDGAIVYYGFVCKDADKDVVNKLDLLTTLIDDASSAFQQMMLKEMPKASAGCYVDYSTPEACVYFYAEGVNKEDAETFRSVVDRAIAQMSEEGFDADAVEAVSASYRMSILLNQESSSIGVDIIPSIAAEWVLAGDLYGFMNYVDELGNFGLWLEDGTFKNMIDTYLAGDKITALSVTEPVAGLKEEEDAAFAAMLAETKAAMTNDEIAAIVASANTEENSTVDTAAMVQELTAVTVESLPEELHIYNITEETGDDGVRSIYVDAAADGVGSALLRLDMGGLTQEQLLWTKLYIDLMGDVDTVEHTQSELSTLATRYLYDGSIRVVMPYADNENGFEPYLHVSFTALDDDLEMSYEVAYELLFEMDLTKTDDIADRVSALSNSLKRAITSDALSVELYRLFAKDDLTYACYSYLNYLDYYEFLCEIQSIMEAQPELVAEGLAYIRDYFRNDRTNAIIGYVGSEEGCAVNRQAAGAFLEKLGTAEYEAQVYSFDTVTGPEALIVDTNTSYNLAFASWADLGLDGYTADLDAVCAFVSDKYLMPVLRDTRGAYGAGIYAGEYGVYVYSYRDPYVTESFQTYTELGDMLAAEGEVTQEVLDGYILSSYSYYATANGELTDGLAVLRSYLDSVDQSEALEYMQQLKAITPDGLMSYTQMLTDIMQNGVYATVSSASVVEANSDLYMNILNPFGVKDNSDIALCDVAEDHPMYEAIRYAYEDGWMFVDEEGRFAPDAALTLGDFAVPLYIAVGGDNSPEDAIEFLSEYEIVPNDPADTELTRDDLVYYTVNFYYAIGSTPETLELGDYADAADIAADSVNDWAWMLEYELILPTADGLLAPAELATRADCAQMIYVFFGE